jgi:hypothetical protein
MATHGKNVAVTRDEWMKFVAVFASSDGFGLASPQIFEEEGWKEGERGKEEAVTGLCFLSLARIVLAVPT